MFAPVSLFCAGHAPTQKYALDKCLKNMIQLNQLKKRGKRYSVFEFWEKEECGFSLLKSDMISKNESGENNSG